MPDENALVQTSVQTVDMDIDSWLGTPGADSIVTATAAEAKAKPSVFSQKASDLTFLDKDEQVSATNPNEDKETQVSRGTEEKQTADTAALLKELDAPPDEKKGDEQAGKGGRPRTEKSGLVEFLKKRIEAKEMNAFDDYDEKKQTLDEYLGTLTEKDTEDLWQANLNSIKAESANEEVSSYIESLPQPLQIAAKYVQDGGQDIKGLLSALSAVEIVREMDPKVEADQEHINRQFLQADGKYSAEEIEDELQTWKDLGIMEKKAMQNKPKLDKMQEQVVESQLAAQENYKKKQEAAAQSYMQNVFEALRPGEINGLKLDKKTQSTLYTGLVQPQYPSLSGRPTNLLGHLLEKYQYVEPNYPLIAEALWLLSNPDEYRNSLTTRGKDAATEKTVRMLKTEQSRKSASSQENEEDDTKTRKLQRPVNIFQR